MERVADRHGPGNKQEQRQQTRERWFYRTAKAGKCSFPMHLYVCNQAQDPRSCKWKRSSYLPQQCLYFFPLPQGHGSLRPTLGPVRMGLAFSTASAASLTTSLALEAPPPACGGGLVPVEVPPNALVD